MNFSYETLTSFKNLVCPACGNPFVEQDETREDTFWIKAGSTIRLDDDGNVVGIARCAHCGYKADAATS